VTRTAEAERHRLHAETRRIEALLRGALGMIEETAAVDAEPEPAEPHPWPERAEEPKAEETPKPQLQKVSGGFDWIEHR
jgi:hypothetical protein